MASDSVHFIKNEFKKIIKAEKKVYNKWKFSMKRNSASRTSFPNVPPRDQDCYPIRGR